LDNQQIRVDNAILQSSTEHERKVSEKREKMEDMLLKVIDDTLKQVFKEAGTKVIYDYLESNPYLKIEEIAEKPELFSDSLKKLLGSAAPVIKDLILKNLYSQLQSEYEDKEDCGFSCHIKELREKYRC